MKDIQVSKDWMEPKKEGSKTRHFLTASSRVISVSNELADAAVEAGAAVFVASHDAKAADKKKAAE